MLFLPCLFSVIQNPVMGEVSNAFRISDFLLVYG